MGHLRSHSLGRSLEDLTWSLAFGLYLEYSSTTVFSAPTNQDTPICVHAGLAFSKVYAQPPIVQCELVHSVENPCTLVDQAVWGVSGPVMKEHDCRTTTVAQRALSPDDIAREALALGDQVRRQLETDPYQPLRWDLEVGASLWGMEDTDGYYSDVTQPLSPVESGLLSELGAMDPRMIA